MTEAELIEPTLGRSRNRKKLYLWCAAVLVVTVAAIVVLVVLLIRDEGYGPLEAGAASGVGGPGVRSTVGGGIDEYTLGRGAAYYFSFLDNAGDHSVEVTRVLHDAGMADVRWAPAAKADEVVFGSARWRAFPATVPANGTIQVRVTISRPDSCAHIAKGVHEVYTGQYFARWRSRRSQHESRIDPIDATRQVLLC